MSDEPEYEPEREARQRPRVSRWAIARSVGGAIASLGVVGGLVGGLLALFHPETPLPSQWNPVSPLAINDPVTPLTSMKLRTALADPAACRAVLDKVAQISFMEPFAASENCHVRNRISIERVGVARIDKVETSCATALRLAMWERHGLQPAARALFQTQVSNIRQIGSYNCRPIRSTRGLTNRWSTHATADAIDISGFDFVDGRRIRLIADWDDGTEEGAFLRAVRDSACTWFATTLGPDFNTLHADHFHLQARGWGTCR